MRPDFILTGGISDAWDFEQLYPPDQAFPDFFKARPTAVAIEFAEHDVIGASLADQHGIMTAAQPASAGDPVRFEHGNGRDKAYSTAQMRAVGASAHHNVRMAVDDKRDIATLHHGGELFCSLDQRALISFLKP